MLLMDAEGRESDALSRKMDWSGGGLCKIFRRNGLQLLNPETKESEGKERTRLPPSSPRSISHDSQTLENLIELSTRNIAVAACSGVVQQVSDIGL